jgi:hypothetical protein
LSFSAASPSQFLAETVAYTQIKRVKKYIKGKYNNPTRIDIKNRVI